MTPVDGSFGQSHNFDADPLLIGKCQKIETVKVMDEEKGKKVSRLVMTVKRDDGSLVNVWESFMLSGLFKRKPIGKQIFIRHEGQRKLKGKKRMNLFSCGVK